MDIEQALKQERQELTARLARVEKSLLAYTGEKKPAAPKQNGSVDTGPMKLPERIATFLIEHGASEVEAIAAGVNAPVGQVATTCSRLVKAKRLKRDISPTTAKAVYLADHSTDDGSDYPFTKDSK